MSNPFYGMKISKGDQKALTSYVKKGVSGQKLLKQFYTADGRGHKNGDIPGFPVSNFWKAVRRLKSQCGIKDAKTTKSAPKKSLSSKSKSTKQTQSAGSNINELKQRILTHVHNGSGVEWMLKYFKDHHIVKEIKMTSGDLKNLITGIKEKPGRAGRRLKRPVKSSRVNGRKLNSKRITWGDNPTTEKLETILKRRVANGAGASWLFKNFKNHGLVKKLGITHRELKNLITTARGNRGFKTRNRSEQEYLPVCILDKKNNFVAGFETRDDVLSVISIIQRIKTGELKAYGALDLEIEEMVKGLVPAKS